MFGFVERHFKSDFNVAQYLRLRGALHSHENLSISNQWRAKDGTIVLVAIYSGATGVKYYVPKDDSSTFRVVVQAYRLSPRVDVDDYSTVFTNEHKSPRAASRLLGSIIAGKSDVAKQVARAIPRGFGGRYFIEAPYNPDRLSLTDFRKQYLT